AETGLSWIPWFVSALDAHYRVLREESAWVRRWPSDVLREHVKFTTQPIESSPDERRGFVDYLAAVEGIEDMLCFSSDYPHWDTDAPSYAAAIFPESWCD